MLALCKLKTCLPYPQALEIQLTLTQPLAQDCKRNKRKKFPQPQQEKKKLYLSQLVKESQAPCATVVKFAGTVTLLHSELISGSLQIFINPIMLM